jgi:hypothetical protein
LIIPKVKPSGELIRNNGFECFYPSTPCSKEPVKFDFWKSGGNIQATQKPEDVHSLAWAVVLGDNGRLTQIIQLMPEWGHIFLHFSFFAKAKGLCGSLSVNLIYLDRHQQPLHPCPFDIIINHAPSYQYQYYQFITAETVPGEAFQVAVSFENLQSGRDIFLDDVSLSS